MNWLISVLAVFVVSIFLGGFMIPQILLISFRKNLFDEPDERKIHTCKVPRLGGISFLPVIFITMTLFLGLSEALDYIPVINSMHLSYSPIAFTMCAMLLIYLVGMADDLIGVRYSAKFFVQILCALLLIGAGLDVNNFHGFLGIWYVPRPVSWITTIGLTLFILNAINFIDGIDGLASGLSSVAFLSYGIVLYMAGEYWYAMIAVAALGVLVPFFYFNVFGDPNKHKKIFMGDTGSLSIGLLLCVLSFKVMSLDMPHTYKDLDVLLVAVSPLVIPCFDVIRVFVGRLGAHKNPFLPDRTHIHHTLLSLGIPQRWAMVIIIASSVLFTVFNATLSLSLNCNMVIAIDFMAFFTLMKTATWGARSGWLNFANLRSKFIIKHHNASLNKSYVNIN